PASDQTATRTDRAVRLHRRRPCHPYHLCHLYRPCHLEDRWRRECPVILADLVGPLLPVDHADLPDLAVPVDLLVPVVQLRLPRPEVLLVPVVQLYLARPEVLAGLLVPAGLLDLAALVDRCLYSTSRSTQAHDSSANFLCCQR